MIGFRATLLQRHVEENADYTMAFCVFFLSRQRFGTVGMLFAVHSADVSFFHNGGTP